MPKVRLTMRPDVEVEVTYREARALRVQGLLATDYTPPAPAKASTAKGSSPAENTKEN